MTKLEHKKDVTGGGGEGEEEEEGQIKLESVPLCQVITTTNRKKSSEMTEIFVRNLSNLRDATCQTSDTETRYLEEIEYARQRLQRNSMERVGDYHQRRGPGDFHIDCKRNHPAPSSECNRSAFMVGSCGYKKKLTPINVCIYLANNISCSTGL